MRDLPEENHSITGLSVSLHGFHKVEGSSSSDMPDNEKKLTPDSVPEDPRHFREMEDKCLLSHLALTKEFQSQDVPYCPAEWNSVSCWPPTFAGLQAVTSCPSDYMHFDPGYNAARSCYLNGTWAIRSDYDVCLNHTLVDDGSMAAEEMAQLAEMVVYYLGYTASFFSCCVALWLFFYFRTLHCLRNTLHCNLIITYILVSVTWIIMTSVVVVDPSTAEVRPYTVTDEMSSHPLPEGFLPMVDFGVDCRVFVGIFTFFQVTNFCWMLVEGLYIILIIFRTHKLELLCYWPFAVVGWGLPILIVAIWVPVKLSYDNRGCWLDSASSYNFVYIGPILLVLLINVIFLVTIMYVLLRKYRGTTTAAVSTQRTAKSFFILLPLLGVTYVIVLVLPQEKIARAVLRIVTAFFSSLQGFFVSLLYCFMNNEVRAIIRLRGNSFFPYRTWLKLDRSQSTRRSHRTLSSSIAMNGSVNTATLAAVQLPPALFRYRQQEHLRRLHINTVTANRNEIAYLIKEQDYQDRIQKQIRHQAMGYRSTVF
ncbi:hypothetical protein RvY_10093-2 [Ramazzottius varieornatus]|nr:hypothetical protein RvY_10093-2 [Ramazzottius varieornatus]